MKTLGLLGGMTYSATSIYYNTINAHVQRRLGGATSANLLIHSFNHAEMSHLFTTGQWAAVLNRFVTATNNLKLAGAEGVVICCNVGHKVADQLQQESGVEVLNIVDFTGERIKGTEMEMELERERNRRKVVGLLGTKTVMEDGFFADRLKRRFGVDVVVPDLKVRDGIQKMIFEELGGGVFHAGQRGLIMDAVEQTKEQGAGGVVFACTELQFVVKPGDKEVGVPVWDTMESHAVGVAEWAINDGREG